MTIQESKFRLATNPAELEAVEGLLMSYPSISEHEVRRIAGFLRTAPSLDVGLLSSNKDVWNAAEDLRAKRPDLFRMGLKSWIIIGLIALGTALMLLWLYNTASK